MDADTGAARGRLLELTSSTLRVVVDLERGGQIVHVGRRGGPNVLFHESWDSPPPSTGVSGYGSDALDWLSHYRGGWQVMFPNAGLGCVVDGVPLPLHGEVSVLPPDVRDVGASSVVLETPTRRPLRLVRRIRLDAERAVVRIEEQAFNESDRPLPVAWGQHPAFHASEGARLDLPAGEVRVDDAFDDPDADLEPGHAGTWPIVSGRDGSAVDLSVLPPGPVERVCYLPDRPAAWAALRDIASGGGVALSWDRDAYPHLWLWEQLGGQRFPFFGRTRIVALEPASCWPGDGLAAAIERGQELLIGAGSVASAWITLALFEASSAEVTSVDRDGAVGFSG